MLPLAFEERMQSMLEEEYPAFLASYDKEKYQALRLNSLKVERDAFLAVSPFHLMPVPWEKDGFYYTAQDTPGKHPYHEAGVYYIQEPSAMAPVPFLEVKPGEKVLDLCAAPGGKSTQIGVALQGKGLLVSNEIHPARAKILSENVERLGIRNAIVTNETPERLQKVFEGYFDKILVDAPCSGEGMFRKNEDAKEEWSPENVALCAKRQDGILDCAADMLRPGGRLVYSTCTFAPQENEGSISRFLSRHPEFSVVEVKIPEGFEAGKTEWCEAFEPFIEEREYQQEGQKLSADAVRGNVTTGIEHTMRIWPHKVNGEGHYLAVLQKAGALESGEVRSLYGLEKGMKEKEYEDFLQFAKESLQVVPKGVYLKFGDQLYLGPENMPAIKNLKVLRPGLHLGTLKKNRFEPSHALALAVTKAEVVHYYDLSSEDGSAASFIGGQTFPVEGEKGWYLITVDGYSLGWGKAAGGIMKNHYPKGLRKN
ncbi:MAG: RsmB/NOP family class I SAM-dependent RNA methyltransferase [Lachnospiraceae bacterium]|nr:RsmB/NOP family class I SAM-dependent RNA methyltransferase [Lachnospiraceae bacterium]